MVSLYQTNYIDTIYTYCSTIILLAAQTLISRSLILIILVELGIYDKFNLYYSRVLLQVILLMFLRGRDLYYSWAHMYTI